MIHEHGHTHFAITKLTKTEMQIKVWTERVEGERWWWEKKGDFSQWPPPSFDCSAVEAFGECIQSDVHLCTVFNLVFAPIGG